MSEEINKVLALRFYLKDSYFCLTATKDDSSIKLDDLNLRLKKGSISKLATATGYDTKIEGVEFEAFGYKTSDNLNGQERIYVEKMKYETKPKINKIAQLLTVKKKQSTASWWNLLGHDWFEISGPEITVRMDKQSLLANGSLPDATISINGLHYQYTDKNNKYKSIEVPISLDTFSDILDLSEGTLKKEVSIFPATYIDYDLGRPEKVTVILSGGSGGLNLRLIEQ